MPQSIERTYADVVAGKEKNVPARPLGVIFKIAEESRMIKTTNVHTYWVKKETEVLGLDWNRLMVISKGCARVDWNEITKVLKEKFLLDCMINLIMID